MPLYVGEYLADTTNLNTEQHGAYCLMLMAAWKRAGSLPLDDGQLEAITKLPPARWRQHKTLLLEFFEQRDGKLVHKRVTAERIRAQEISDKKALNGRKGAKERWQRDGETDGNAIANAMANELQTDAPIPLPLHNPDGLRIQAPTVLVAGIAADSPGESRKSPEPAGRPTCPAQCLVDVFHETLPELPRVIALSDARRKHLTARWREVDKAERFESQSDGIEVFRGLWRTVARSDFLMGRAPVRNGSKPFQATFDWLINPQNFLKVAEGNYARGST